MVAVRKKKAGKWAQPKRHKMTVLLGDELFEALEHLCASTGLSKNSAVLLGATYACAVMRAGEPGVSRAALKKELVRHLDSIFPG